MALLFVPLMFAFMVTDLELATALVETGNVALLEPLVTLTLEGTAAAEGMSLDNETTAPAVGADAERLTVA